MANVVNRFARNNNRPAQENQGWRNLRNVPNPQNPRPQRDQNNVEQNDLPLQVQAGQRNRQFKYIKSTPTQVVINQELGPEALRYLRETKFAKQCKNRQFFYNDRYPHPHGSGAYYRSHGEGICFWGYMPKATFITIGGNAARINKAIDTPFIESTRQTTERIQAEAGNPPGPIVLGPPMLTNRVRSMCPNLGAADQIRHDNWKESIEQDQGLCDLGLNSPRNTCWVCTGHSISAPGTMSPASFFTPDPANWRANFDNAARARAIGKNRCLECAQRYDASHSSDSVYYDGVLDEHEWRAVLDGSPAYFGFYDYHTPITKGTLSGNYFDNEGSWRFNPSTGFVEVHSTGNDEPYTHKVVQTGGQDTWIWKSKYSSYWLLCNSLDVCWQRDVPYRIVRMRAFKANTRDDCIKTDNIFEGSNNFFLPTSGSCSVSININGNGSQNIPRNQAQVSTGTSHNTPEREVLEAEAWKRNLRRGFDNGTEKVELIENDTEIRMTRRIDTLWPRWLVSPVVQRYQAPLEDVVRILARVACTTTLSSSIALFKKFRVERERQLSEPPTDEKPNPDYVSDPLVRWIKIKNMATAFSIAEVLSAVDVKLVSQNHASSLEIDDMKTWTDKANDNRQWLNQYLIRNKAIDWFRVFGAILVPMLILLFILESLTSAPKAQAWSEHVISNMVIDGQYNSVVYSIALAAILASLHPWMHRKPKQRVLDSVCVRDPKRLKLPRNNPFFKIRDPKYDVKDLRDLPCERDPEMPGAVAIFPEIVCPGVKRPTVVHPCARTQVAASIRALGNNLYPDKKVFSYFSKYVKKTYKKEVLQYLDNNVININIADWLAKYPEKYRKTMEKEMAREDWQDFRHYKYKAFPKVELQVTDVEAGLLHTSDNTVKERQICGPDNRKKILGNPIIAAMQEVHGKCLKGYCGNKNLTQIAAEMDMWNLPKTAWLSSDGSGFDMTQTKSINKLYMEIAKMFLDHPNVILETPLDREQFLQLLADSLVLDVDVCNGAFNYKVDGRASGDGWTTDANTLANVMYYRYTWAKTGFFIGQDYNGWFKGDDMIAAFNNYEKANKAKTLISRFFLEKMPDKETHYGLGQIVKFVLISTRITDHTFLNCNILETLYGLALIMRIDVAMQKFAYTTKFDKNLYRKVVNARWSAETACQWEEHIMSLLLAKLMSYKAFMGEFPIFRALVLKAEHFVKQFESKWHRKIKPHLDEMEQWYYKEMASDVQVTSIPAYYDFLFEDYGLTASQVHHIEKKIMKTRYWWQLVEIVELHKLFAN